MSRIVASSHDSPRGSTDHIVEMTAGATIFREGDLGTEMYIVRRGEVEILQRSEAGERRLAVMEQGDFFGEMALLDDLPRSASARALSDVRLVEINRATFVEMLRRNPEIAVRMMRKLSRRFRQVHRLLRQAVGSAAEVSAGAPQDPPPDRQPEPAPGRLVHEASDVEFGLAQEITSVGRHDPVTGVRPNIDLTVVDDQRSSSRRHATIRRDGERFLVREELGVMNGTFVNGDRLAAGDVVELRAGDRLRLGLVELVFLAP